MDIHAKLVMAVTEYDRKQSNSHALGHYLAQVADIDADIAAGASVRAAIVAGFGGAVLEACLKAVGEPKATDDELRGRPVAAG